MEDTNPLTRLLQGPKIWNVAVIDNIDFKDQTFYYGNIYDATRTSSHATVRMIFQFTLSKTLQEIQEGLTDSYPEPPLFGLSEKVDLWCTKCDEVFDRLLHRSFDFDNNTVHQMLQDAVEAGCNLPTPNVVILKPGKEPNSNTNVFEACEWFWNDLTTKNSEKTSMLI